MRLTSGGIEDGVELAEPPIGVAGGRFLGWLVPSVEEASEVLATVGEGDGEAASRRGGTSRSRRGAAVDREGFDPERMGDARRGASGRSFDARRGLRGEAFDPAGGVVGPEGQRIDPELLLPRVSRRVTVLPGERIGWRLERSMPGARLADGEEPYLLKVRADRLTALQPERPERPSRDEGEDARDFRLREMAAQQEYRAEVEAFRTLRELVLALPERFEQPMPGVVWAVYDAAVFGPTFGLEGPAPLPWSAPMSEWEALRALGAEREANGQDGLSTEVLVRVSDLVPLAERGEAAGGRLLAEAMSLSGVMPGAMEGGPVYEAALALLKDGDAATAERVVAEVVSVIPPTPATMSLMREAAGRLTPGQRLASLRAELSAVEQDPEVGPAVMRSASAMLLDADGPSVAGVLEVVTEGVSGTAFESAAGRLPVGRLTGERWAEAVAYLAERSASSAAAAALIREQVLRATPAEKVASGLAVIAGLADLSESGEGVAIPMSGADYPLIGWLDASAGPTREAAWSALPRFVVRAMPVATDRDRRRARDRDAERFADPERFAEASMFDGEMAPPTRSGASGSRSGVGSGSGEAAGGAGALLRQIASLPRTPGETMHAAAFLGDQPFAEQEALTAFIELVGVSEEPAGLVGSVVGSGQGLGRAMASASAEAQGVFAEAVLRRAGTPFEGIGALVAAGGERGEVARWFGDRVASGRVPDAAAIAKEVGEDRLIDMAGSGEQAVRRGAAAGLTALAGGSASDVTAVMSRLDAATDRTTTALKAAWLPAKQELSSRRLYDAQGTYRLLVQVPGADEAEVAGLVDVLVDGRRVAFAGHEMALSIPEDALVIRVEDVAELKALGVRSLVSLPLERVDEPMDLQASEGSWSGTVDVPGAGELTLRLEPAEEG
jgi:hypothetical protein